MSSSLPLRLPCTVYHHQHIHRMKEQLARFKKFLSCNFSAIYQFFFSHLNWILNLLVYFMQDKITKFKQSLRCNFTELYRFSCMCFSPFCNLLIYLLVVSSTGFFILKVLRIKNPNEAPKDIDMLFTAVSAATLSSLSTVEMEVFSNSQLIVLTILTLLGGEVLTSLIGLQFKRSSLRHSISLTDQSIADVVYPTGDIENKPNNGIISVVSDNIQLNMPEENNEMKYTSMLYLSYVILGYLLAMHIWGIMAIIVYLYSISDARRILREKGLNIITFSVFTTVSSFSNCGFLPTNESMILFRKQLGLLLLVITQSVLGGALYPPALRSVLWFLNRMTKKNKFEYILRDGEQLGYDHLFPWLHSLMLVLTVLGIFLIQFVAICAMEWSNEASAGWSLYEKLVNYLFLVVNSRHTGESTWNLSMLTPAVRVLLVFVMYLPPYTTFMPLKDERSNTKDEYSKLKGMNFLRIAHLSPLFYLAIFVMTICITERDKISEDPLNFNIFSITFEVVSAFGNVGYSMGYSCSRRLAKDGACHDTWTSFVGRWSTSGKVVIIVVMFLGGLKRYTMAGGKAWKLRCKK